VETTEELQETQDISAVEQPQDAEGIDEAVERLHRPVEALLFVASESMTIKQIAKLTHASEMEIAATLQRIEADFADRGIVLREIAGGYRFASAPAAREVVEAYLLPPKTSLSTPALETLAIVAYMQPVTKSEIEAIRGVASDSVVSTLLDRNLVSEAGRKDVVGRPMLYKTTPEFLESFGMRSLDDLPPMELEAGQPLELDLLTANITANVPQEPAAEEPAAEEQEAPQENP
jgi:segregation and condensation protein B